MLKLNLHARFEIAVVAALLLGGCDQPRLSPEERASETVLKASPVARFQAVPSTEGRVWIVDTRFGSARLCLPGQVQDVCGEWIK